MSKVSKTSVPARFLRTPTTILAAGLTGLALLLAGCGQKGPLTLPMPAPAAPAEPASAPR